MRDEVLELLRKNLIDVALDNHDWERLKLLTSPNYTDYVISPFYQSPFDFLCYDEHFLERRIMGNEQDASLNYRFQEFAANRVYVGEIYIPLTSQGSVSFQYRLKNRRTFQESATEPAWFTSLVNRAQSLFCCPDCTNGQQK